MIVKQAEKKEIPGCPGFTICNNGTAYKPNGSILKPIKHVQGYWSLHCVSRPSGLDEFFILPRLVLNTFGKYVGTRSDRVIHLDGDDTNCHIENLKWHLDIPVIIANVNTQTAVYSNLLQLRDLWKLTGRDNSKINRIKTRIQKNSIPAQQANNTQDITFYIPPKLWEEKKWHALYPENFILIPVLNNFYATNEHGDVWSLRLQKIINQRNRNKIDIYIGKQHKSLPKQFFKEYYAANNT